MQDCWKIPIQPILPILTTPLGWAAKRFFVCPVFCGSEKKNCGGDFYLKICYKFGPLLSPSFAGSNFWYYASPPNDIFPNDISPNNISPNNVNCPEIPETTFPKRP
jgi:hypothetical protein